MWIIVVQREPHIARLKLPLTSEPMGQSCGKLAAITALILLLNLIETTDNQILFYSAELETRSEVSVEFAKNSSRRTSCTAPWTYNENGTCKCGEVPNDILQCNVKKDSKLLSCNCLTFNEKESITELGNCMYSCSSHHKGIKNTAYTAIPPDVRELNEYMCGRKYNRDGTLCGRCRDGFYPLANSYNISCVRCLNRKHNWWKFVLVAFLPLTLFYLFVIFFQVNVTASQLHGFVFYSQITAMPIIVRMLNLHKYNSIAHTAYMWAISFYGIWNLDFFCFANLNICLGTGTLETQALDLTVTIFPFLLMILSYIFIELHRRNFKPLVIAWKPFGLLFGFFRENWGIQTSLINAFTTFFLLANVKVQCVSFGFLVPVVVHKFASNGEYNYSLNLYYDATVPYFGRRHLPYAILAIALLLIFGILPIFLLIVYPLRCFQKLLNFIPVRWHALHIFMDSFQGCYKDGSEPGTRDCRWFSCVFFFARLFLICIGACTLDSMYYPLATIVLVVIALLFMVIQPFKETKSHLSAVNVFFILLLALTYASLIGIQQSTKKFYNVFIAIGCISGIFPLCYIAALIVHWMYSHRRFGSELIKRVVAWKHGYAPLK